MATPAPQSERRRAPRALADFPIQLSPKAESKPGRLKDISEIGLACTFGEKVEEMTLVAIDFKLPGRTDAHRVKGAVVRCEPVKGKKGEHEIAIYFTEITPVTKAALRGFVSKGKPAP